MKAYSQPDVKQSLNGWSPSSSSSQSFWYPVKEREEDCRSQSGWGTPGKHVPLNQLSEAHMGSETEVSSMRSLCRSVPGTLHNVIAASVVFLQDC